MFNLDTHARPGRSPKASARTPPGEARCCPAPILLGDHAPSASSGGEVTSILCSDPPAGQGSASVWGPTQPHRQEDRVSRVQSALGHRPRRKSHEVLAP